MNRDSNRLSRAFALVAAAALSWIATGTSVALADPTGPIPAASPEEQAMYRSLSHSGRDNIAAWHVCDSFKRANAHVSDEDQAFCAAMEGIRSRDLELRRQRARLEEAKGNLEVGFTGLLAVFFTYDPDMVKKVEEYRRQIAQLNARIAKNERDHLRYARQLMQEAGADPSKSAPSTSVATTPPRPDMPAGADRRPAVLSGNASPDPRR